MYEIGEVYIRIDGWMDEWLDSKCPVAVGGLSDYAHSAAVVVSSYCVAEYVPVASSCVHLAALLEQYPAWLGCWAAVPCPYTQIPPSLPILLFTWLYPILSLEGRLGELVVVLSWRVKKQEIRCDEHDNEGNCWECN